MLHAEPAGDLVQELQQHFGGKLVVNGGFMAPAITAESAAKLLEAPFVDAVAVGRAVIANPDLVSRWKSGHPENEARPELFYAFTADGHRLPVPDSVLIHRRGSCPARGTHARAGAAAPGSIFGRRRVVAARRRPATTRH
ncbi:hypothetical protein OG336_00340 [[Kitasatospora] papulosa]|uniref:hypothetical protein n=1 Tax=[Kitasatospora] papulosa TaxID=1464011 RepID=UPI002E15F19E|nr:hypothetical protein OG336_00340 [[Kitasatospora] papulosa]